jgi:hypothetical protein
VGVGKILLLVFGVIIILVAVGLMFGGGTLLWLERTHTDEGFIASDPIDIERGSHAIVTGSIDIDEVALDVLDWLGIATAFAVEGSSNDPAKNIFIGVGEESDVEAYLSDVEYDEMSFAHTGWLHFERVDYINHPGGSEPAAPAPEDIWRVKEYGAGTQTMEWETEVGSHSIVLMNDDGSAGVDLDAVFKVKVGSLLGISVGLLVGGIVVLLLGALMIVLAVRRS